MNQTIDTSGPILLRFAQPERPSGLIYRYDVVRKINVVEGSDGTIRPAVDGPELGIFTKTLQEAEGED